MDGLVFGIDGRRLIDHYALLRRGDFEDRSTLTVSLPLKTMSVVSFVLIPAAVIVTCTVLVYSPNIS